MATESQIVVRVDRETLQGFRAECTRRGSTPTREIARLMEDQLQRWLQEMEEAWQERQRGDT
jgi:hypothetical protein